MDAADWAIAYYDVVVTVVAFLLWARGVARVRASTAAVFTGVLPISAVTLSYLILGERVLWSHLLGGACVLAAILLVAREEWAVRESPSPRLRHGTVSPLLTARRV